MPHNSLQHSLLKAFQNQFDTFESTLLWSHENDPHFLKYLAEYRGVGNAPSQNPDAALQVAEKIVALFKSVCAEAFQNLNGIVMTADDVQHALQSFEERINLSLLYWYGAHDKNFQFRTLVHYYDWEGLAGELFHYGGREYCVTFFTDGFRIAANNDERLPRTASLLLGLGPTPITEKHYFARLRTVQNQLIFLVDTWEYRNTVLAVEQGEAREHAKRTGDEKFYKDALQMIEEARNQLATFVTKCFADFEEWLAASRGLATRPETQDEWDATHALLLSGLQKAFLPGSISRHKFSLAVVNEVNRWAQCRNQSVPHDFSTALTAEMCQLILTQTADMNLLVGKLLAPHSLNWSLSFDVCTPLKAFSWSYAFANQRIFCLALILAFAKKMAPEPLDRSWLESIAAVVQMPVTFSAPSPLPAGNIVLDEGLHAQLKQEVLMVLNTAAKREDCIPLVRYLKQELEFSAA